MDTIQNLLILLAFPCKIPSDWQPRSLAQLSTQKWEHEHEEFRGTWCLRPQGGMVFAHTPETLAVCLQPEAAVRAPEELSPRSSQGRNQTWGLQ